MREGAERVGWKLGVGERERIGGELAVGHPIRHRLDPGATYVAQVTTVTFVGMPSSRLRSGEVSVPPPILLRF